MDILPMNESPMLLQKIENIRIKNEAICVDIQNLQKEHEAANNIFNEFIPDLINSDIILEEQQKRYDSLMNQRNSLIINLRNNLENHFFAQNEVIDELKIWQRRQALFLNGGPAPNNLNDMQSLVEALFGRITEIISLINNLIYFGDEPVLNVMLKHAMNLHNVLIFSALIVEIQPKQIIKKGSKFESNVRWLIGTMLKESRSEPIIKCEILSEAQARRLSAQNGSQNFQIPPESNGEMTGKECKISFDSKEQIFSANFTHLVIKHIERSERRGPEIVMDKKYTLLFYTTIKYKEYEITCWTLSLPLVVVVHASQEPQSLATVIWDNAFSEIGREPFKVPDNVHYKILLETLDMKFTSWTGRSLTAENLNFLREKLLYSYDGPVNEYISYSQFCRGKLPNYNFTFWEWFYAIMKLTKEHLKQLWMNGHIVGFINKRKTKEEILESQPNGTFLLRFSDSTLGGITIAYRNYYNEIIEPWTGNDLQTLSLADRIRYLPILKFVYPTYTDRDAVLGISCTQQSAHSGYVPSKLIVHISSTQPPPDHQM